jgi:hypothetical protein
MLCFQAGLELFGSNLLSASASPSAGNAGAPPRLAHLFLIEGWLRYIILFFPTHTGMLYSLNTCLYLWVFFSNKAVNFLMHMRKTCACPSAAHGFVTLHMALWRCTWLCDAAHGFVTLHRALWRCTWLCDVQRQKPTAVVLCHVSCSQTLEDCVFMGSSVVSERAAMGIYCPSV